MSKSTCDPANHLLLNVGCKPYHCAFKAVSPLGSLYQSATALLTSGKDEEEEEGSSCMQLMLLLLMWLKVLQCCFGCGMQSVGNTYQTIEQHKSVPKHVTKGGRMLSKGLTLFC